MVKYTKMVKKKPFPYELIGNQIIVVESTNKNNVGMTGRVVDETKFTLVVEEKGLTKRLFKRIIVFKIKKTGQLVDGKDIVRRPEERLKH